MDNTTSTPAPQGDAPKKRRRHFPRAGHPTKAEKNLIQQFVLDQPAEMKEEQVRAMAKLYRRPIGTIKEIIEEARASIHENAPMYVEVHRQSALGALAAGEFDTAAKAAQWALGHLGDQGVRVVDRPEDSTPAGPRVMIGIKLGGIEAPGNTSPTIQVTTNTQPEQLPVVGNSTPIDNSPVDPLDGPTR